MKRCESGHCVEFTYTNAEKVVVWDSKDPEGGALHFDYHEWADFIQRVKDGHADLPQ